MLLFVIENIQTYAKSCTGALIFLDSRTVDDPIPVPVPLVLRTRTALLKLTRILYVSVV